MAKANCNWWQYARWVYLVGRSGKFRPFTESEQTASIDFVKGMLAGRPWLKSQAFACLLNIKYDEDGGWDYSKQNWYSVAKMLQKIGRNLKVVPPTEEEKALCDALFEATDSRRHQFVKAASYTGENPETNPQEEEPGNEPVDEPVVEPPAEEQPVEEPADEPPAENEVPEQNGNE